MLDVEQEVVVLKVDSSLDDGVTSFTLGQLILLHIKIIEHRNENKNLEPIINNNCVRNHNNKCLNLRLICYVGSISESIPKFTLIMLSLL
jgi:hypothetical protein